MLKIMTKKKYDEMLVRRENYTMAKANEEIKDLKEELRLEKLKLPAYIAKKNSKSHNSTRKWLHGFYGESFGKKANG